MDFYTSVYNALFYVYYIWKKFSRIFGKEIIKSGYTL